MPSHSFVFDHCKQRVLLAVREGMSFRKACQLAGVKYCTFQNWSRMARQAKSGKFFEFFEEVKRAMVEGEEALLKIIAEAARGGQVIEERTVVSGKRPDGCYDEEKVVTRTTPLDWKPAAWLLARRDSKRWGNEAIMKVGHEKAGNGLSPEEFVEATAKVRNKMLDTVPDPTLVPAEATKKPVEKPDTANG